MRAVQIVDGRLEVREVPVPEAGPGQVRLRVAGAGLCHSDLHMLHTPRPRPPFTLGHETAGWVDAVGEGVDSGLVGQAVIVSGAWGCGHCPSCAAGDEPLCRVTMGTGSGLSLDGGLAELMVVPAVRHLVPLGDLDPRDAAPLADAALTPYHVVRESLAYLHPGETAVVIGVGGLGHAAVQILRALSAARVVAVDSDPKKLALAEGLGAHATVRATGEAVERDVRAAVGAWGAGLVMDCVGVDDTLRTGAAALRPGGRMVIVGVGGGTLPVSFMSLPFAASVGTTYWGTAAELAEVVELARRGLLRLDTVRVPLEDVPATYDALAAGRLGAARAVATPNG